jgi:arsenate reductase (glutaredoxin)
MEAKVKIYHNNRCSKSRDALTILSTMNVDFEVVDYIKNPLTEEEVVLLLSQLNLSASDVLRKVEDDYKTHILGKKLSDQEIITLIVSFPKLLERPIALYGNKAVIARPPEKVHELFAI